MKVGRPHNSSTGRSAVAKPSSGHRSGGTHPIASTGRSTTRAPINPPVRTASAYDRNGMPHWHHNTPTVKALQSIIQYDLPAQNHAHSCRANNGLRQVVSKLQRGLDEEAAAFRKTKTAVATRVQFRQRVKTEWLRCFPEPGRTPQSVHEELLALRSAVEEAEATRSRRAASTSELQLQMERLNALGTA